MMSRWLPRFVLTASVSTTAMAFVLPQVLPADDQPGCQTLGTQIQWTTAGLDAAAQQARNESKLLLILHISGNFAKSAFT